MKKIILLNLFALVFSVNSYSQTDFTVGKITLQIITDGNINDAIMTYNCEDDAFDGTFNLYLDGNSSSGTYFIPSGLMIDTVGTNFFSDIQVASGLNVTKEYYITNNQVIRLMVKIENPVSTPINNFTFSVYTNYGSDGGTQIDSTSDGDMIVEDSDKWIITSDGDIDPITNCADPILTYVRNMGTTATMPGFINIPGPANGFVEDTLNVSIPGNDTRYALFYYRMDSTLAAAKTNSSMFSSVNTMNSNGLFDGIPTSDYSKVLNLNLTPLLAGVSKANDLSNALEVFPNPASHSAVLRL